MPLRSFVRISRSAAISRPANVARVRTGENAMRMKRFAAILLADISTIALHGVSWAQGAQALIGEVRSAEEGPMSGVTVTATRDKSTVSVTVVTDDKGRYSFPADRLVP